MSSPNCLHFTHANINLDAFFEMTDVSAQEYMFLAIVEQYQKFGWCEPKVFNNLTYKQGLINHIAARVRYTRQGGEKAYTRLLSKGYLQESDCKNKFRCTAKYFVLSYPPKENQAQNEAQNELKGLSILKFSYSDTPYFKDFDVFTSELKNQCKKLPDNTDFKYYFEYIKQYYTTENKTPYTIDGWKVKLKSWLNRDIQARRVQLVKPLTGGNVAQMDKESLLKDVFTYGDMVAYPQSYINFKQYKETVLTFVSTVEAVTPQLLETDDGKKRIELKNIVKAKVKQAGALLKFLELRKQATIDKNTEGVKITNEITKDIGTGEVTEQQKDVLNDLLKLTNNLKI